MALFFWQLKICCLSLFRKEDFLEDRQMAMHGINSKIHLAYMDDGGYGKQAQVPQPTQEQDTSIFAGAEGFDAWSNSEAAQDEFTMFNLDLSTYSKDLNEFAQSYIDSYDSDGDSNMSFEEFVQMASNGEQNPQLLATANELYNIYKSVYENEIIPANDKDEDGSLNLDEYMTALGYDPNTIDEQTKNEVEEFFNSLNTDNTQGNENQLLSADELLVGLNPELNGIDSKVLQNQSEAFNMFNAQYSELDIDGDGQVSSEEWATMLYASDLDWENYAQTGDIASSVDGKLNWNNYQAMPSIVQGKEGYDVLRQEKLEFFNNFYAS